MYFNSKPWEKNETQKNSPPPKKKKNFPLALFWGANTNFTC